MAMLELEKVTLGDVEGQGYAFTRKTAFGKSYFGVFFAENDEELETLKEEDELDFSGTVYHRRRSGKYRKSEEEMPVSIVGVTPTGLGERVAFEAVENPDETDHPVFS